ncbi:electron transfer flavoprotein subunit beta/FixA family protein [Photobacterium sp. GB-72]|uniref:electron transfer flavoprotein subunit beta/FixA family protein n=1 Tax=Photobacterium sp. GB-72 TaxID=2022105 RepID=UPI000D173CD2|nr:electron transfer flavoprotein subunit beta/FixA family protein [Photobacterium sp. GB-72]PSV30264.1 electron transporter RnfB [Photobacterium sp. GB-72]
MAESTIRILVAIKRVVDPYVAIRVKDDNSGIDDHNVKKTINPFCAIALEQAVQFKEQGIASEVVVICIGDDSCNESLRTALALGADSAIHINTKQTESDNVTNITPLKIAMLLSVLAIENKSDVVLMGKQSIDGDNNQTPQMLAGILDCPQATYASEINYDNPSILDELIVTREVDGGLETLAVKVPCVISCDLRLNTPRFASLPNIMKAKAKPLTTISLQDFIEKNSVQYPSLENLIKTTSQTILHYNAPKPRTAGVMVDNVDALIDKLSHEVKVI